ncbi:MAG: hypothetical protein ACRYF5_05380 [Janthinobacterium lividum]
MPSIQSSSHVHTPARPRPVADSDTASSAPALPSQADSAVNQHPDLRNKRGQVLQSQLLAQGRQLSNKPVAMASAASETDDGGMGSDYAENADNAPPAAMPAGRDSSPVPAIKTNTAEHGETGHEGPAQHQTDNELQKPATTASRIADAASFVSVGAATAGAVATVAGVLEAGTVVAIPFTPFTFGAAAALDAVSLAGMAVSLGANQYDKLINHAKGDQGSPSFGEVHAQAVNEARTTAKQLKRDKTADGEKPLESGKGYMDTAKDALSTIGSLASAASHLPLPGRMPMVG